MAENGEPTLVKKKKKKGAFAEALVRGGTSLRHLPAAIRFLRPRAQQRPHHNVPNTMPSMQDAVEDEQAEADAGDLGGLDLTKKKKKKKAKVGCSVHAWVSHIHLLHTGSCRGGIRHG